MHPASLQARVLALAPPTNSPRDVVGGLPEGSPSGSPRAAQRGCTACTAQVFHTVMRPRSGCEATAMPDNREPSSVQPRMRPVNVQVPPLDSLAFRCHGSMSEGVRGNGAKSAWESLRKEGSPEIFAAGCQGSREQAQPPASMPRTSTHRPTHATPSLKKHSRRRAGVPSNSICHSTSNNRTSERQKISSSTAAQSSRVVLSVACACSNHCQRAATLPLHQSPPATSQPHAS